MDDISYMLNIFLGLSILGMFIKYALSNITIGNESGAAFSSLIGLGIVGMSMFGILVTVLKYYYDTNSCSSTYILTSILQLVIICSVLALLIYQNVIFYDQINNNSSSEYATFSSISSILTIMQLILVFYCLKSQMNCLDPTSPASSTSAQDDIRNLGLVYVNGIVTLLNYSAIGITFIILKYFYIC